MDKNKLMEQLRKAVREVIQEELGKSSYDAKSGISTTALTKDGKPVGYIKHKETDKGLVAGGRIGPKAAKAVTAEEKTTINIPVAALPSYKKGEQPTVINPKTGEEEIESDVSSWAKALEGRFGHLKRGQTASLKGDPQDVKKKEREELDELNPQAYRGTAFIRRQQAQHIAGDSSDLPGVSKMKKKADDLDTHATNIENKRRDKVLSKDGRVRGSASGATLRKFGIRGENVESYTLEEWMGMMEEAGYSLEEGAMDTLRHAGRQVRDTVKGIGRAGKAVLAARRGGDAKSMMGLIGHDLKTAYQSPARVKSIGDDGKMQRTDHEPGAANILRRLRDYGQDTELSFGKREPQKKLLRYPVSRTINQSPEEIEFDATPRPSLGLPSRLARHLRWDKEHPDTDAKYYSTSESYTLEEFLGMLEEAGYSLQENDPYRDRNPNPEPQPGEIPQGDGGMIGYRGIPRGPAPKPDPYRDRNPNPEPQPGEIPQGGGLPHIEERNKENKAKKDAEIADTGWALRGQPGGAKGGTPNDELVKNKQRGRKDAKTVYGDKYDRQPGRYIPKTELGKSLLKGLKPK